MNLFFVGVASSKKILQYYVDTFNDHPKIGLLVSFAYPTHYRNARAFNVKRIMVDSGAFTAEKSGKPIDIDELIAFLNAESEHIVVAVALDDISDYKKSIENYHYMREHCKVDVMPVWHVGEPWHVLDYYVSQSKYVGIGGMAGDVVNWRRLTHALSLVFSRHPDHHFHAFGINDPRLVSYPFHSCDALTWRNGSIYGQIICPPTRFHLGSTEKALSESEAERLGVGDWLRERGIPFPLPEDFDWTELDKLNMRTLVEMIVERAPETRIDTVSHQIF